MFRSHETEGPKNRELKLSPLSDVFKPFQNTSIAIPPENKILPNGFLLPEFRLELAKQFAQADLSRNQIYGVVALSKKGNLRTRGAQIEPQLIRLQIEISGEVTAISQPKFKGGSLLFSEWEIKPTRFAAIDFSKQLERINELHQFLVTSQELELITSQVMRVEHGSKSNFSAA